jgi:hypothetical protein
MAQSKGLPTRIVMMKSLMRSEENRRSYSTTSVDAIGNSKGWGDSISIYTASKVTIQQREN